MIEMCRYYTTSGYPSFKPLCKKGHRASLKCHSINYACLDYMPSTVDEFAEWSEGMGELPKALVHPLVRHKAVF